MTLSQKSKTTTQGFTLVELLIATSVFAVVLLTALAGFIQIGRLFYKGVTITQTQAVSNQVMQDVTGHFRTASNISALQQSGGYNYYCVGNARYTFKLNQRIDTSLTPNHLPTNAGNFALLKDTLPGSSACAAPCSDTAPLPACPVPKVRLGANGGVTELLAHNMRLGQFTINATSSVSNFYTVNLVIAYGTDDLLACGAITDLFACGGGTNPVNPLSPSNKLDTLDCYGKEVDQQFCSVVQLSSGIYKGF